MKAIALRPAAAEHHTKKGRRNGTVANPYTVETDRTARHGLKRRRPPRPLRPKPPKPIAPNTPTNQAISRDRPEVETSTALTPKQSMFCQEYLVDLNATQAAIRAGYSPRSANEQAARALAKASIRAEVNRLLDERTRRVEVDADFVVRVLVENVLRSMQAIPVVDNNGIPIGEYRYNGAVANKALELLGRHLGMFGDKNQVEHSRQLTPTMVAQLLAQTENRRLVVDASPIRNPTPTAPLT